MKHTSGPWAIAPSSNPKNGSLWRDIVSMGCEFSPSYVGEALEHDAHLIAAAPDLLAALRDMVQRYEQLLIQTRTTKRDADAMRELLPYHTEAARAAIAAAEGQA